MRKHQEKEMSESPKWALLTRYLCGECSESEIKELEAWMHVDPENERLLKLLQMAWDSPEPPVRSSNVQKLWNDVAERAGITRKTSEWKIFDPIKSFFTIQRPQFNFQLASYRTLAFAAVFLAVVSSTFVLLKNTNMISWTGQNSGMQTLIVQNGDKRSITLDDGTRIVLDAGSVLQYPATFTGNERKVVLQGEGYFEVEHDPGRPFIVQANHAVVQVLGTKFNVRAWEPDHKVTVAVAGGKVSLGSQGSTAEATVLISAGKASTLPEAGPASPPHPVDIDKHLGWRHNEADFDDAPLHEILYQLERWYDVQFVLADSSAGEEHLTVHIQKESLPQILDLVSALTDLEYACTGKIVYLESNSK